MRRVYGRGDAFDSVANKEWRRNRDIFSNSTSSSSDSLEVPAPKKTTAKRSGKPKIALTDVSNVPISNVKAKPKGKRAKKRGKDIELPSSIPNFDSFDNFELVVQPVTPIKTHVSISTPTTNEIWGNIDTQEILAELEQNRQLPVTSSPGPTLCSTLHHEPGDNVATDGSQASEQDAEAKISTDSSSGGKTHAMPLPTQLCRKKRLRQLFNESSNVSTSTPDQRHRKAFRPSSSVNQLEVSLIPVLDVDASEGHNSNDVDMLTMSIESISIHDSLKGTHSPVISGHVDELCDSALTDNHSSTSLQPDFTGDSIQSSQQISASLFSTSCSYRSASQLDSILEEPTPNDLDSIYSDDEEENEGSLVSVCSEMHTAERSFNTPTSGDAAPGPDNRFSQEQINALNLACQNIQSPTISELRERRLRKQLLRHTICSWSDYRTDSEMEKFVKIGEGVYGEVYKLVVDGQVTIIKVVPMEGKCTVNDEPQKRFHEMVKEVEVTRMVSEVGHNFIHTKRIVYTRGVYPDILLNKWDDFAQRKHSENNRPDYFPADQYYTVFEFSDGGEALETYEFKNAAQALSCLLQVGWCLAVAEDSCQFEHRDLHWGNILIAQESAGEITYTFPSSKHRHNVSTSGVKVHIIDFTLSRLVNDKGVVFFDLSTDEMLFKGYGDYQFDVYRQMKDVTGNDWRKFYSVTNILWMRYLADKLLKNKTFPSKKGCKPTGTQLKRSLLEFFKRCEHYHSAIEMVLTDELFIEYSVDIGRQVPEYEDIDTSNVDDE